MKNYEKLCIKISYIKMTYKNTLKLYRNINTKKMKQWN